MCGALHHSDERLFDGSSIRAIDWNVWSAAIELELKIGVGIPRLKQSLVVRIFAVVITNEYF
jgi:hypothetical protein